MSYLFLYHSGEKGNPTYVTPEDVVETTEFAEEEIEIKMGSSPLSPVDEEEELAT